MGSARHNRDARARQAAMGRLENGVHEQQRSESTGPAGVPQIVESGLGRKKTKQSLIFGDCFRLYSSGGLPRLNSVRISHRSQSKRLNEIAENGILVSRARVLTPASTFSS